MNVYMTCERLFVTFLPNLELECCLICLIWCAILGHFEPGTSKYGMQGIPALQGTPMRQTVIWVAGHEAVLRAPETHAPLGITLFIYAFCV